MGIRCSWPINKYSNSKDELFIDISNAPISQRRNNDKLLKSNDKAQAIILIQKFYRGYTTRKHINKDRRYSLTGETKSSIVKVNQNSIKESLLDNLFKQYPPLKDNVILIQVKTSCPGIGEYSGEWNDKANERHGRGIQVWIDNTIYIGYWKNDLANGKGKLIDSKGDYYEGEFVKGRFEGAGTYTILNGPSYKGEWKNDLQDGYRKEIWPDKTEYTGDFIQGIKTGKGVLLFNNGSKYEGDFYRNQMHGFGSFIWKNQSKYIGQWSYNKMDGEGIFYFQDGKCYKGHYVNDKKEGYGIFRWPNGKIFKGNWKKGKMNEKGEMFYPEDGKWRQVTWDMGKRIKWK